MLLDFELAKMRAEKKSQGRAKSPAVEIAMKLAKSNNTEKQVRKTLSPFIDGVEPPEIMTTATADPLYKSLMENGFIEEV